jgi:hypothetical protein
MHRTPISLHISRIAAVAIMAGSLLLQPDAGRAERASRAEMELVAWNWLSCMVQERGSWAGAPNPAILKVDEIVVGDTLLARCFSIAPRGYVLVSSLKELSPVQACSEDYPLEIGARVGVPQLLREILTRNVRLYASTYGDLDASQPGAGDVLFSRDNHRYWDIFTAGAPRFDAEIRGDGALRLTEVGPLLTTAWHQNAPYYNNCPLGDGGRCVVGCVATAAAQIMRFHQWPPSGTGSHSYHWDGDQSCGDTSLGQDLTATFSDTYDWAHMPNSCDGGCTLAQGNALAELSYEVGVAFDMDYGVCGSGAYTNDAVTVLPQYFGYEASPVVANRSTYTADGWFALIQSDINADRPMLYAFRYDPTTGHAVVCDGWRTIGDMKYYHINYGWGGDHTDWFTIDNIYHTVNPMYESIVRNIKPDHSAAAPEGPEESATGAAPGAPMLQALFPNPLVGETRVRFGLPAAGPVRLAVYDVGGRERAVLADRAFGLGWHTVTWGGRDAAGNRLPRGVYLVRFMCRGETEAKRMVILD